jgi:hypothetical protein
VSGLQTPAPGVYRRHRPETTALYEVVRDNLETLYGAIGDGAIAVRIPRHARKELEGYLDCGLLCRGFARLKCEGCGERRLVAFSCKGRGSCPSCTGRRMNATSANLIERVLPPQSGLRQWVLTFPFSWRRRLAQDGAFARPAHAHRGGDSADVPPFGRLSRVGPGRRAARSPPCRGRRPILRLNPHLQFGTQDELRRQRGRTPSA